MGLIQNLVEHHKSLRFIQRYVDQLVLFVSAGAMKQDENHFVYYSAKSIMFKFIK